MMKRVQNTLFYVLVFLLPLNLGKHYVVSESYVKTHLIDYLIPTIWVTDILVLILVLLWLLSGGIKLMQKATYTKYFVLFIAVLLPSVAISPRMIPSLYFLLITVLHVLFMFVVATTIDVKKEWPRILGVLSVVVILLSFLAVFQWNKQGAVFNNYLFFGEQPYDVSTNNIALLSLFGRVRVPAYATFRHPNIFAGFLAIILFWIYSQLYEGNKTSLYRVSFGLGVFALILTFSEVALFSLLLSIVFLILIKKYGKPGVLITLLSVFMIFFFSLFLPLLPKFGILADDPSIFRRSNLEKSSYSMLEENALFGVGLNNFTVRVEDFLPGSQVLRFIQPVHNIFLLTFTESGIFALVALFSIFLLSITVLLNYGYGIPAILYVTILQFSILGSFDHYLLTMQQTQLLFWLTVGLALAYTKGDVEV